MLSHMDPDTEKLIKDAAAARLRYTEAKAHADQLLDDYRAKLQAAVDTGVRGVKIAVARAAGVSDETIRLDANAAAREVKARGRAR